MLFCLAWLEYFPTNFCCFFFKFKAGGILEKIHSTDDFLVKNSKETVHLAAILIEEIKELLTKK